MSQENVEMVRLLEGSPNGADEPRAVASPEPREQVRPPNRVSMCAPPVSRSACQRPPGYHVRYQTEHSGANSAELRAPQRT